MCLVLPTRVVALNGSQAEVELADGQRAVVNAELKPDLVLGDYVLVDRGFVIETVSAEEARAIMQIHAEIAEMVDAEDALVLADAP